MFKRSFKITEEIYTNGLQIKTRNIILDNNFV